MTAAAMRAWIRFAGSILVVAVLYLAQAILVPLALATLLTFLLTPVVVFLQRRLGRVPSVMVVILLVSALLGGIGWGIAGQLRGLAHELPHYRDNIRQRILDVRVSNRGSAVEKVQETVKDIQDAIEGQPAPSPRRAPPAAPAPTADKSPELWSYPRAFGSLLDGLVTAGLVAILAIFMLLERQELRNRLIRLTGFGRVGRTTKALDEASSRISRYLLVQSLINGTYGLGVSLGLYLLGVPHALLWGFLGALLRFVPYVGPWIAALAPIALSLGVFPGWVRPLLVVALMIALELFTNLVLETFLYAGAAGVSALGLLVAVTFWTWLWGAPGLLMAIPLTVCLVVFSRHVPGLQFLATLLGDEPALTPDVGYYQRLLAGDRDEAADIVEEHLARGGADTVYDAVILPALNYGRRDADDLSAAQLEDVVRGTLAIVDDVTSPPALEAAERSPGAAANPTRVLGYPAMGEADEAALLMLRQLLDATRFAVDVGSSKLLSSEVVAMVRAQAYPAVCVVALPPGGLPHARYLCKKLRVAFPDLRILVGRWGPPGLGGEGGETLLAAGADAVGTTLLESRDQLYQLAPLLAPART